MTQKHDEPEFNAESTLIPESSFVMDGDTVEVVKDGEEDEHGEGGHAEAEVSEAGPSALKKFAPFIVVGALAVALGGGFAYRKLSTPAPRPVAAKPAMPASAPVAPAVESPAQLAAPIEVADAMAPGAQSVIQSSQAIAEVSALAPTSGLGASSATSLPSAAQVASSPTLKTPAAAQVASSAIVAGSKPDDVEVARIDGQLRSTGRDINDLRVRVERLEQGTRREPGASSGAADAKPYGAAQKSSATAAQKQRKATQKVKTSGRKGVDKKVKRAKAGTDNVSEGASPAGGYSVHMVRDNLAWLRSSAGEIRSFSIGEVVPGLGKLTKIDEYEHTATIGTTVVK